MSRLVGCGEGVVGCGSVCGEGVVGVVGWMWFGGVWRGCGGGGVDVVWCGEGVVCVERVW